MYGIGAFGFGGYGDAFVEDTSAAAVSILPPSIVDARSRALEQLAARATGLSIEPLLVRRIPSVPDAVLPAVAWERGMLGTPAWTNASDIAARRGVVTDAILRHRRSGTAYAVRRAIQDLGWSSASVQDAQMARKLDGTWKLDGNTQLGVRSWWQFDVSAGVLASGAAFAAAEAVAIQQAVDAWRPARSRLKEIVLHLAPITQTVASFPLISAVTRVAIGSGTAAGLVPLTTPFIRRALSVTAIGGGGIQVAYRFRGKDAPTMDVREIALLDNVGTVLARVVRPSITRPSASSTQAGVGLSGTFTITP